MLLPDEYRFFFLWSTEHPQHICTANGLSVTVQRLFEFVHCPINLGGVSNKCILKDYVACKQSSDPAPQQCHQWTICVGMKEDPAQPLTSAVTDQLTWEMLLVNQVLVHKNQDIGLKTKCWQHCWARAWFSNQDLVFFEQVLGLQVSVETGESAQPLATLSQYHWSTDDTVVRVHWPALQILESGADIYYIL